MGAAGDLAVEADLHQPVGSEQRGEDAEAAFGVLHVVEDAHAFDDIEAAAEAIEVEDVGVHEFDVDGAELARPALRESEAGAAQIHGQDVRAREPPRAHDGVLAGAATGDENLDRFGRGQPMMGKMREQLDHDLGQRPRLV